MTSLCDLKQERIQCFPFVLQLFYLPIVSVFIYDTEIYRPLVSSVLFHYAAHHSGITVLIVNCAILGDAQNGKLDDVFVTLREPRNLAIVFVSYIGQELHSQSTCDLYTPATVYLASGDLSLHMPKSFANIVASLDCCLKGTSKDTFSFPLKIRNRVRLARPIIMIPRSSARSKAICVIPDLESRTGILICAAFMTISEVNLPVIYRILSSPETPSIHILPEIVSAALFRPTSSMNMRISAPRQRPQP